MTYPFHTIGHSNRSLDAFVALLNEAGVRLLVDIRTVPRSRANPQFNRDTLPASLAACAIDYEHVASLGGLRGKSKTVTPDVNRFWQNDSFHHYADYAMSDEFRAGLNHLISRGHETPCAMMCSEAVWWRCHRRIVADHLMARGEAVFHIMSPGRIDLARPTPGAIMEADGTVFYPNAQASM